MHGRQSVGARRSEGLPDGTARFALNVFATLRGYRPGWLGGDLTAGVMLAAIAVPEQLATAKLAGFPVEVGLIAFAAGTLAMVVFGTNRFVSAGADSTTAPIFAAALGALTAAGGAAFHGLASLLAIVVGALLLGVGLLRAGWVTDLLSVPVTTGFLAGISVHIIAGQLPSLLGIADAAGPLIERIAGVAAHAGRANPFALAIGAAVLAVTLAGARISERLPAALIALAGAGVAVALFGLRAHDVAVVGELHVALPALRFPPPADLARLGALAPLALVVAAVCALQTSLVVRSFPSTPERADDVSGDFIALGVGNVLAGLGAAFPVNVSPPRTAVVAGAGGRSQLSGMAALAALAVLVTVCARFAAVVPQSALAGVLIFIGLRLFRWREMRRIARYSRREFGLVVAGALLVIVLPIQTGMLLAIMLSLTHGVTLVMWPPAAQLFLVRGTTVWWPATGERDTVDVPGVLVFAPAAPVNFTNAQFLRARLLALVEHAAAPVELVVIEAGAMTDVDYTGSQMLQTTIAQLRGRAIDVALARLITPHAQLAAERSGLIAALGADRVFLSVADAVAALAPNARPADTSGRVSGGR